MKVKLDGRWVSLAPAQAIGKGGEADVYEVGGRALKLFKGPDHPDLAGNADEQEAARRRLLEHQEKLRALPPMPAAVVAPESLAEDRQGRIVGYAMRLVRDAEPVWAFGEASFRAGGPAAGDVVAMLRDLHVALGSVHRTGVVVGDFNDMNVLVAKGRCHLIDADSYQFGRFRCALYTGRFVDPTLCDPSATHPVLMRPHGAASDWYAFAAMLVRSLLLVDPYGGVHRPKDPARRIPHAARPLRRITIFDPEVLYPRAAIPFAVLPDELLEHLHHVFEKDLRIPFPPDLLEGLRFTRCVACSTEHARPVCPACTARAARTPVASVRGTVTATRVLHGRGRIIAVALDGATLRHVVHDGARLVREDGAVVAEGATRGLLVRIAGDATLLAGGGRALLVGRSGVKPPTAVDAASGRPCLDAAGGHVVYAHDGLLLRHGPLGPERIGDVLARQTRIWLGERLGLGLSIAGTLRLAFLFRPDAAGIRDGLRLPVGNATILDAEASCAPDRAWLLLHLDDGGRRTNRALLYRADGELEAMADVTPGDGSWLGEIRGHAAVAGFLLAPTDSGVVRVEAVDGLLQVTKEFPDTAPFVHAGCRLLPGGGGLYVVDAEEIRHLRMG